MAPGSSVVPERVAVKCIGGINDPHTARFAQQEADVLKQLDGRAYMVKYHSFFKDPLLLSVAQAGARAAPKPCAYLLMG